MSQKLLNILQELKRDEIVVSENVNEEARSNTRYIPLSSCELISLGKREVCTFLERVMKIEKEKWCGQNFIMYCWFDDMARHIRVCSISEKHKAPPFSVKLQQVLLQKVVDIAFRYIDESFYNSDIQLLPIYIERNN